MQQYLDLLTRPAVRDMVRIRAAVVRSVRESFHDRGFVEVETPTLHTQAGGAAGEQRLLTGR